MQHVKWVFSGIGVLAITLICTFFAPTKCNSERSSLKLSARVLIVDHDENCKLTRMLINAGWVFTKNRTDVENLDAPDILEAQVIFVNAEAVGASFFNDQGYGLAAALKERYPDKKIVNYGVDGHPNIILKTERGVDAYLPKNAESYEFIKLLDSFFK
jgi:hypothetical protein